MTQFNRLYSKWVRVSELLQNKGSYTGPGEVLVLEAVDKPGEYLIFPDLMVKEGMDPLDILPDLEPAGTDLEQAKKKADSLADRLENWPDREWPLKDN